MTSASALSSTSAMPYAVGTLCVALVVLTGVALWWAFADFRDHVAERAVRVAEQHHRARHDGHQAPARPNYNQIAEKNLNTPTGSLDPQQIARLMETTR